MRVLVPLRDATDPHLFGGKAAQLAAALRGGLPVPDGVALAHDAPLPTLAEEVEALFGDQPVAVRSSALDEDGARASFAGAHESVLGARGARAVTEAVARVRSSGAGAGATAYRERLGLGAHTRMGIVIHPVVTADTAGVLFTRNPLTGADERVAEASWGLGEAVVSSLVTPDYYRFARGGRVLQRMLGEKDTALVLDPVGGTLEVAQPAHRVAAHCLTDHHLAALDALADACDRVFGATGHDVEFAFVGATVHLLQRRPITRG